MYWELGWYALVFFALRDVVKYSLGPLQPDRDALANATYVGVLGAFLLSFAMAAKHRWLHGVSDVEHEGQLVASHIVAVLHGHVVIREKRLTPVLVAAVAVLGAREALAADDGVLHRVLMIVLAVADLAFPCVVMIGRYPRQATLCWRGLMAAQWAAVVAAVLWEINHSDPMAWHLVPLVGVIPWLFPTEHFTSSAPTEDLSVLTVLDATYVKLVRDVGAVYHQPALPPSSVKVELLEDDSEHFRAKRRRRNRSHKPQWTTPDAGSHASPTPSS